MRIGSRGYIDVIKANLARPGGRVNDLYMQLGAGKRINKLSDDPLAAARTVRSHNSLTELDSRKLVVAQGTQLLGATDTALGSITTSLTRVKDLVLRASNQSLAATELAAIAQEIGQISSSMAAAANINVHGQYVFAGSKTDTVPFTETPTGNLPVAYNGNGYAPTYKISSAESVAAGVTGANVFNFPGTDGERPIEGVDTDVFSLLKDVVDSISRGDTNRVATLSSQVEDSLDHVVSLRGHVGALAQRYEHLEQTAEETDTRIRELLATDEDLDYASAITDLRQQETIYEAVMGITSRMMAMSNLFETQW